MKIKEIHVKRLVTLEDYQNITLGYTAVVENNEKVEEVLEKLVKKIDNKLAQYKEGVLKLSELKENIEDAEVKLTNLKIEIKKLKEYYDGKIKGVKHFFDLHGIN